MSLRILALGAWLKNRACLLDGDAVHWSETHGDLRDARACHALEASARALVARYGVPQAIAHDLHPDFFSTQLAVALAAEWGIPAIGVQHHHAHIAAVMAEHRITEPVIGLALDGVGLGTDGKAWGGELLRVRSRGFERLGHLWPLAMPGGDVAAREPWRMLVSAMHAMGRSDAIPERVGVIAGEIVGESKVRMIQTMLARDLQCPTTSSAGRWFDVASAALGLAPSVQTEAEAAIALEHAAAQYAQPISQLRSVAEIRDDGVLDLRPLLGELLDWNPSPHDVPQAAAWFHLEFAEALADWTVHAARGYGASVVCLSGGCFFNAVLSQHVESILRWYGLRVLRPVDHSCGDAGLALGQAWVVAQKLAWAIGASASNRENSECV